MARDEYHEGETHSVVHRTWIAGAPLRGTRLSVGGRATNGGTNPAAWSNAVPLGTRSGAFSADIAGLLANQTNYYRCLASNVADAVWASESAIFTTHSPSVVFDTTFFQVQESGPAPMIGVRLDTPSAAPVSVGYRTVGDSAVAGSDYVATEGRLTWGPGETGVRTFSIEIINDQIEEPDEEFHIELLAPTNAVIADPDTATVLILDDDGGPTLRFAEAASTGCENQTPASIRVTMSPTSQVDVTVNYTATGGTAINGTDYELFPGSSLIIPAGAVEAWIEFTVLDNTLDEPDKTVVVTLLSPVNARLGQLTSHTYTILDDDASPPQVDNGNGAMRITRQSATLRGAVLDTGGEDPDVYVCWGSAPGGETTGSWSRCVFVGERGVGAFEWDVDQLTEGITYYYRVVAINSGGEGWAERIEHFVANDPPTSDLTYNPGMETSGANNDDAQHWARSATSSLRRKNENPRAGSFSMEFDAVADIFLYGTLDNVLLLSWNGLIADTDTSHPLGGVRPGFVVSSKGYTRTVKAKGQLKGDQMNYRWRNMDAQTDWMQGTLFNASETYQEHHAANAAALPSASVGQRFRPELIRETAQGDKFYADDLTLTASLPKLHLEWDPVNTVAFARTTVGNSRNLDLRARNAGGGAGTVLYGAFITDVADLRNPSWDKTAWRIIDDPAGAFQIMSGAQLISTNDGAYQACTIRFTPPGVGVYTSVVRVATTDPVAYYGNSGTNYNSIVYYQYTLVAEGVAPTLTIGSTAGGAVTTPGEGAFQRDYGTVLDLIATPDPGFRFDKWTGTAVTAGKVANPDSATTTVIVNGDHTLTAHFIGNLYTLTFNSAGGSAVAPITQAYGTAVTAPANPTRTGYTFDGWSPAVPATMPAADQTHTAQWTVNEYTLTFDSAGGSAVAPITQDYGTAVTAPANPTRTGYSFAGWTPAVPETMPSESSTLTAQWTVNAYTLDVVSAHGNPVPSVGTHTNDYGMAITNSVEAMLADSGTQYVCLGWVLEGHEPSAGDTNVFSMTVTNAAVLSWQWATNHWLAVEVDGNGTVNVENGWFPVDTNVTVTAIPDPYHHFTDWSGETNGAVIAGDLITVAIDQPRQITAHFVVNAYTLTFNSDGGSEVSPITQDYGTAVTAPDDPTRTGYSFAGWSPEVPETMPAANQTHAAQWTLNAYTLTFNSDGGSEVSPITQAFGTAITVPDDPTREGHSFAGWSPEVPETMPAADQTLVAQWTVNVTDPVSAQAVPNNPDAASRMDLSWGLNSNDHAVMIVRSTDGQFFTPVQGTPYSIGYSSGNSTVIYNGTGTSFTDMQLYPRNTYSYRFHAYHDGTYSPGITRSHATKAPKARNSGGGAPQQPATVYLGDRDMTFGVESWTKIEDRPGSARLFIARTPDLDGALAGPATEYSEAAIREPASPVFTDTGLWFWGIQLDFETYGNDFWYCKDWSTENETERAPVSSLTVNVLPLPPVANPSAKPGRDGPGRRIDVAWTADWDRGVLVVRRQASAPGTPTQGQEYGIGDECGGGTVVFKGVDPSFTDRGLPEKTTCHYAIFTLNNGYYSDPVRIMAETGEIGPMPTMFKFR